MTESQYTAHVAQLNEIIEDLQQKLLDRDFELQSCADSAKHDIVHSTPQSSQRALVCTMLGHGTMYDGYPLSWHIWP